MHDHEARAWIRCRLTAGLPPAGRFTRQQAEHSAAELYGPGGILPWVIRQATARKLMGAFRYEQIEADGLSYDDKARLGIAKTYVERLRDKLALYEQTGNAEALVDCFNYLLLEIARPIHPLAHFQSTERHEG